MQSLEPSTQPLLGRRILVASGPTCAPLDDVRFISNRSTGRLGSVLALALQAAGADVIQLAGENSLTALDLGPAIGSIEIERFLTVDDLKQALRARLESERIDALLMAAAVLDYLPGESLQGKRRSDAEEWTISLRRGEKLIERIHEWSPKTVLVGFKLESRISLEALLERAAELMDRSGAQSVVANRIEEIGEDRHIGYLVTRNTSGVTELSSPLPTREAIAEALVGWLTERFRAHGYGRKILS